MSQTKGQRSTQRQGFLGCAPARRKEQPSVTAKWGLMASCAPLIKVPTSSKRVWHPAHTDFLPSLCPTPGSCQGQTPWTPQRTRARARDAGKLPRAAPRPQTHSMSAPAMKEPGFEEMRTALLTASLAQISFITSVNSAFSCLDRVFT